MATQPISSTQPGSATSRTVKLSGLAQTLASGLQEQLPTLATALVGKHREITGSSGNDRKGSLTVRYTVADKAAATAAARTLRGGWSSQDESLVGDNLGQYLSGGAALSAFQVKTAGNHVDVKVSWNTRR